MKISKIVKSQHVPDRFYLEFENGEKLTATIAQIADYSLFTGRELEEEEMEALRNDAGRSNAKAKALRIIGERSMSCHDVYTRLLRHDIDEDTAKDTVAWLEDMGLINDSEYAAMLTRHYAAKGYGEGRIRDELYKHGIPRDMWGDALSQLPDMDDGAYTVLIKKLGTWNGDEVKLKKALGMLQRRGFSWDEIRSAVERLKSEIKD